jgi:hypothetical protein
MAFLLGGLGLLPSTTTTNTVENITKTAIALSQRSISKCFIESNQEQNAALDYTVVGDNNKLGVDQSLDGVFNLECKQKSKITADIGQSVVNAIKQEAKSTGVDFSMSNTEANNHVYNLTSLEAEVNMDSIVESVIRSVQKQNVTVNGTTVGNNNEIVIKQNMTKKAFTDATMDAIKSSTFVQNAANDIDQKAAAETKSTIAAIANAISNMATGMMIMMGIIVLAVCGSIAYAISSVLSGDNIEQISSAVEKNKSWGGDDFLIFDDY